MTVEDPMLRLLAALLLTSFPPQSELVLVKEGAAEYHRPHCEIVRNGIGVLAMTRAQAEGRKLKPHAACDPEKQPAPTPEPSPSTGAAPAAKKGAAATPTYVFLDPAGKHYHRETCKRLGKTPKKMLLDEAGKKYWPCSVCRPPIRPRKR